MKRKHSGFPKSSDGDPVVLFALLRWAWGRPKRIAGVIAAVLVTGFVVYVASQYRAIQ